MEKSSSEQSEQSEKSEQFDIDFIFHQWPFKPGVIAARLVRASDGREVMQMRIEMGLLQMEIAGRPDGEHPGGMDNCFEWLQSLADSQEDGFELNNDQCTEVDREFLQFYQRRICCLALRKFAQAVADADYTLKLMDFVASHCSNRQWTYSHEQYRPFVLFHRVQAAAMLAIEKSGAEAAIEAITQGEQALREAYAELDTEGQDRQIEQEELLNQLTVMKETLRQEYHVGKTLAEQLADAIASEQYERAARLRDEIAHRRHC